MYNKDSKIAVVGAGAIGGITAGFIARVGYNNVEIVCKHQEIADKFRSEGVHIFGINGDHRVTVPAVARIPELREQKDIVFLATKATDMLEAARELLPFLTDKSIVVSLQNGICEDAIAEVIGRHRTIGCVVGWGATMHGPGELEMTSTGEYIIGNIDSKPDIRLLSLEKILSSIVPVERSENIMGNLYSELIINSCINSLGAICGLYLGKMLSLKKYRSIFIEIIREAIAVADEMYMKVEVYAGKLDYYRFLQGSGFYDNFRRHLMIRVIGFKYRRVKSSSLQSLERGKPTEIDFLNGYISSHGKKQKVPTPVNDRIIEIVKEIEAGTKKVSPENFDDPFFDNFR
ncbi:MAG: 2-dehydropantoate 2-reductase [Syntrophaceae bacterium]|nr:2-dehydropantoate 2-reductase [Syntrophaceae bacterium]